MHALPRRTLRQLIDQYGPDLLDNPARVDALLADHCGEHRAERFVLVYALRERFSVADRSDRYWRRLCSRRLQSRYCFSSEAAQWAAGSWSSALRIDLPKSSTFRDKGNSLDGLQEELSNHPIHTLRQLLTNCGFGLLNDPARVNALLADLCGEFSKERFLLIHALREGIPAELLSHKGWRTANERRLTQRLIKHYGFSDRAAQWAVESWSAALHHAAPATVPKPEREKRKDLGKVLGRLSLRQVLWLGLLLVGVVALASTWQSAIVNAERGATWLLSIPGSIEENFSQFVAHVVQPAITWALGIPGLITLGTLFGLVTIRALGPLRVWRGVAWLIGITWLGMGIVLGRLSFRQKMWSVLGLIGIVILAYTWQSAVVFAEWGVAWLQSVPKLVDEMLTHFVVHVALPAIAWLVGIPGLIVLGTISGLLTVRSIGLSKVWRGFTRLIVILWLGLGKVWIGFAWLVRISWLGLQQAWKGFIWLIRISWLGLQQVWKGFIWLIKISWLGLQQVWKGLTWLIRILWLGLQQVWKGFIWLIRISWLGLQQVWKGFIWLIRISWLGLGKVWIGFAWLVRISWLGLQQMLGQLSLRQQVWLGLGLMAILTLSSMWQSALVYTERGVEWLLSTPGLIESRLSQIVIFLSEPEIAGLEGIPGLIALGAVSGLLTVTALGLTRVWKGIAWLMRLIWKRP